MWEWIDSLPWPVQLFLAWVCWLMLNPPSTSVRTHVTTRDLLFSAERRRAIAILRRRDQRKREDQ